MKVLELDDTLSNVLEDITSLLPDLCLINKHANLSLKETIDDLQTAMKNAIVFIENYQTRNKSGEWSVASLCGINNQISFK